MLKHHSKNAITEECEKSAQPYTVTLSYEFSNLILKAGYPYSISKKLVKSALQIAALRCTYEIRTK